MTGFNLDFSKAAQTGGVKDGTYECVVNQAFEDATPGGSEYINLDLIIRNDFDQPYKNAHIFPKIWKAKADGKYNEGMIMAIAQALQLQDGKQYNGLDELLADFVLKPVLVTVKNEKSESNGKEYDNLNVKKWDKSNLSGPIQHQFKNGDEPSFGNPNDQPAPTIGDDDLPF